MKTTCLLIFSAALFSSSTLMVAAEKPQKVPDVSSIPFFTVAKRGHVPQMVPGLTGAFLLNDKEKADIVNAYDDIYSRADVQAAKRLTKGDPKVTEADREAARRTMEKADAQFHERLEGLLTADRKDLIGKINRAYEEAELGAKPAGKEGKVSGTVQTAIHEAFVRALEIILTKEQKQGMAESAEKEALRAANAQKTGKPK